MKVVLIDNYDSFTYILAQYIRKQNNTDLTILKNDTFHVKELQAFSKIIISPGPGLPETSGSILDVIRFFSGKKPILGVCLGLQAIYQAFGGRLQQLQDVHHGVSSHVDILDGNDLLFRGISSPFLAGRYHSWVCDPNTCPEELIVSAIDTQRTIMACRHRTYATYGVQFHPESILTPEGHMVVRNFIERIV